MSTMNPLTRMQVIAQISGFIVATLETCVHNPARRWALFQEIQGVLKYVNTLDDDTLLLDIMEKVWAQMDVSSEEVFGMWRAYNA